MLIDSRYGNITLLGLVLLAAAVYDLKEGRIPNALTFPAMLAGLLLHAAAAGTAGLLFSLQGLGLGLAIPLVLYLLGQMGAGDAKLMAAVGSFIGPEGALAALFLGLAVGGAWALVKLLADRERCREDLARLWSILRLLVLARRYIPGPPRPRRVMRFGPAAALGGVAAVSMDLAGLGYHIIF